MLTDQMPWDFKRSLALFATNADGKIHLIRQAKRHVVAWRGGVLGARAERAPTSETFENKATAWFSSVRKLTRGIALARGWGGGDLVAGGDDALGGGLAGVQVVGPVHQDLRLHYGHQPVVLRHRSLP